MKAIHLTAYGNPAQNLRMVEVTEPDMPSAGEARVRITVIRLRRWRVCGTCFSLGRYAEREV